LGGVLAGLWLVGESFAALGWEKKARTIRIVAVIAFVAVMAFIVFGPEVRSNTAIGAISAIAVRFYAVSSFGPAYEAHISNGGAKRPQWHWVLAGVLGMAAVFVTGFSIVLGLAAVAPDLVPERFMQ
jgi:hypothetical protein